MEILQNTIIKLIVRQGPDSDRKQTKLATGELAFATDSSRLYIGNISSLSGGVVVGNIVHPSTTNHTTIATSPVIGDLVYDTDKKNLYKLDYPFASSALSCWGQVGGVYSGSKYIDLSARNNIFSLNPLSANALSNDLVTDMIYLSNGKLALSANIPFQRVSNKTFSVSSGLVATVNGLSSTGIGINPLSSDIIISVDENYNSKPKPYGKYNGLSSPELSTQGLSCLEFYKYMTGFEKLSTSQYRFIFDPLPTINYIATIQIYNPQTGNQYNGYPINQSLTSCDVKIINIDGSSDYDRDMALLISY